MRTPSIVITVSPIGRGSYSASVDGRVIVPSSRTPFFAAARALVDHGTPPDTMLIMRHAGSETDSLKSMARVAARLTVDEAGLRFRKWEAFDADSPANETPVRWQATREAA